MIITLKNGQKEFENGMNALDIAGQLSQDLKKQALCARVNGEIQELVKPINEDCTLEILTFEDDEAKKVLRHTASHVLAQAVKKLRPEAKLAIGPAIDTASIMILTWMSPLRLSSLKKWKRKWAAS